LISTFVIEISYELTWTLSLSPPFIFVFLDCIDLSNKQYNRVFVSSFMH
jgi:hypothetical protein